MKYKKRQRIHLRTERKKRGWSAHYINQKTKIPLRYIEALETGNLDNVQKGSRLFEARIRYLTILELPLDSKITFSSPQGYNNTETTGDIQSEGVSKNVAYAIILVMIAVICIKLTAIIVDKVQNNTPILEPTQLTTTANIPTPKAVFNTPDFQLYTTGNTRAIIVVDGEEIHNDVLQPNKRYRYNFTEKLELWSDNISLLNIELHGEKIAPQGAVANERKLIFTIDRAAL